MEEYETSQWPKAIRFRFKGEYVALKRAYKNLTSSVAKKKGIKAELAKNTVHEGMGTLAVDMPHVLGEAAVVAAKKPTFKEAQQAIMKHLEKLGWEVKTKSRQFKPLKFPYANDPSGKRRLWFKKQAVWLGWNQPGASINDARSIWSDVRDKTPEEFVEYLKRWMK
jgi:hypothetical protein